MSPSTFVTSADWLKDGRQQLTALLAYAQQRAGGCFAGVLGVARRLCIRREALGAVGGVEVQPAKR